MVLGYRGEKTLLQNTKSKSLTKQCFLCKDSTSSSVWTPEKDGASHKIRGTCWGSIFWVYVVVRYLGQLPYRVMRGHRELSFDWVGLQVLDLKTSQSSHKRSAWGL